MARIPLKRQILLPFSLACLLLFFFSLFSIYHEEEQHIDRDFLATVNSGQKIYDELLDTHGETLRVALGFLLDNQALKEAFRGGDREALLDVAEPIFRHLRRDKSITHFYFMDPARKNVLRVHQPERYGDIIDRHTMLNAEKSGALAVGMELGPLGTFTLRAVAPWREKGELLGYVELGGEVEHILNELALMFNAKFSLLISKQYLDRQNWERGMRMLDQQADWDQLADLVVAFHSGGELSGELLQGIRIPSPSDPLSVSTKSIDGKLYRNAIVPLSDAGGRLVGGLLLTQDVTGRMAGTVHTMWLITALATLVGLGLFTLFYRSLDQIEDRLESRELSLMEETKTRLAMQEEHVRELERSARYDGLTGLPNRRLLEERVAQAIATSAREARTFALLLADVDRLREINDTLGHEVGDRLLQQVAMVLREHVSEADTIARLTGGEFVLLVPATDLDGVDVLARKIQRLFARSFQADGTSLMVGVRLGIVLFPDHGDSASVLLRHADVALHQAKRLRAMQAIYDNNMDPFSRRKLSLVAELRKALTNRELKLHYQPQLDTASGRIVGVEALARWHHPQEGFVSPLEFIALAENCGLIGPLTDWALDEAVRQCREWEDQGLAIKVAVNVSAHNFMDAAFPGKVAAILARHRLPPERLILEVTESVFMLETDYSLRVLDELRDMGTQLSIDDFGTGYSSLAYLKRMPVHELKIDQNFVRDMANNESDANIVSSAVALAHGLGMKTVAEGVETAEALKSLRALGCDVVQGYHFSRPVPPADLLEWVRKTIVRPEG